MNDCYFNRQLTRYKGLKIGNSKEKEAAAKKEATGLETTVYIFVLGLRCGGGKTKRHVYTKLPTLASGSSYTAA